MGKGSASWTPAYVDIFLDLCFKELESDNRPHTHFSPVGWENLRNNFNKETGENYTKKQLKNKWDSLKDTWKNWKDLKGKETGLGWNHRLQTIDASDEWWENKIKINDKFEKLRKKGLDPELEGKLDKLFYGVSATGSHAWAPSSGLPPPSSLNTSIDDYTLEGSGDSDDLSNMSTSQVRKRKTSSAGTSGGTSETSRKRKGGGAAHITEQINKLCEAISNKNVELDPTSIKSVMSVVTSLPGAGIRTPLWYFATRLFLNKEKREMFCTMDDPEDKLAWLQFEMSEKDI